jgi:hypothetical protein
VLSFQDIENLLSHAGFSREDEESILAELEEIIAKACIPGFVNLIQATNNIRQAAVEQAPAVPAEAPQRPGGLIFAVFTSLTHEIAEASEHNIVRTESHEGERVQVEAS